MFRTNQSDGMGMHEQPAIYTQVEFMKTQKGFGPTWHQHRNVDYYTGTVECIEQPSNTTVRWRTLEVLGSICKKPDAAVSHGQNKTSLKDQSTGNTIFKSTKKHSWRAIAAKWNEINFVALDIELKIYEEDYRNSELILNGIVKLHGKHRTLSDEIDKLCPAWKTRKNKEI